MKRVILFLLILTATSANSYAGTKTWNNASGGNWSVGINWLEGTAPVAGDDIIITLDGNYTVTYDVTSLSVASITIGGATGTQTITHSAGRTMTITGSLTINANGVFHMTGGSYSAGNVINNGTIRLTGTSYTFSSPITNSDSLLVGGTNVTLSGNLTNQSNVYITTGTLNLSGGSSSTAGNFTVSSGATLNFNSGTHSLDAASSVSGAGNVTFNTATTITGIYNITGTTVHSAGTTTFNGAPGTLVSIADSLHMSGGTLNLITGDSIIVPKIRMNSATTVLLVNAPIRFTKTFTHNAGTVRGNGGSGVILVSPGLVYDIPTSTTTRWQKLTLQNEGTIQWSGSFSITLDSGVVINNYALFNPQSTATVTLNHNSGTMSQFNNYGTYRRSIGTTVSNINALFNGFAGSLIEVQTGTLAFNQNCVFTDADASVSSGALLQINDTSSWDAASSISGAGNVEFSSVVTMSGNYNIGGYTSATGGTTTFDGTSGSLISIGDSLYMASATLRLFTGDSVIVGAVRMNSLSGVLSLNAPLRFTRTFTHNAGTLNGLNPSVAVIVSPGLIYNASTNSTTRWRRLTLQNYGTVQWSGTFSITLDSGVVINNYGLFNPQSTGTVTLNYGVGAMAQFNNYGTYRRSIGTTVSNINALFNGFTGSLIEVQSGTLAFNQNSVFADADASVSSGTLLQINDTSSWDAASSISGSGNVQFDAASTVSGGYTITGTTSNTAGATVFNNGSGLVGVLDSVYISSGTLNFSTADTAVINKLQLSGGTLTGSAPVKINTVWNWTWGTVSGTDSTIATVISPGAALNVSSGSTKTMSRRTVVNYGTMIHTGTSFTYTNGAVFDNKPFGVIDLAGNNSGFSYSAGTSKPRIKNSGLVKKSAGTASTIAIVLENTNGRVEVQTSSLTLSDTSKWVNSVDTVFAGATLIFSGGTATQHKFDTGSRLAGYGNVTFSNGTATLSGTYDILGVSTFTGDTIRLNGAEGSMQSLGDSVSVTGGTVMITTPDNIHLRTMRQSAGTFNANMGDSLLIDTLTLTSGTFTGSSPVRVEDLFTWTAGSLTGTDSTVAFVNSRTANLTSNTKTFQRRTFINDGAVYGSGANWWDMDYGAVLINSPGAVIDFAGDWNWNNYPNSGSDPVFVNYGTLRKSAGTSSSIQVKGVHSSAAIEIESGVLQFTANSSYVSSDFILSNHAILQFNGGIQSLDSNSDITGTGAIRIYNGTNTLKGIYNVTDSSYFIGGTTDFTGSPNSLQNLGAKLRMDGGTTAFANGDSIIVPTYWHLGGTLTGNSPMRITGNFIWSGGVLEATDSTVTTLLPSGVHFAINGGFVYLSKRTLTTYANTNWNTGVIRMINGSVWNNQAGSLFDIKANNYMEFSTSSTINNYGTFRKSGGTGTSFTDAFFNNFSSRVEIKTGTFEIRTSSNSQNSVFMIDSAATIIFTNAGAGLVHNLDSVSVIKGNGTLRVASGTNNFRDTIDIRGETFITGGTSTFSAPLGTMVNFGKKLTVNGTAYFVRDTLKVDSLVTTGTLGGTAPIYIKSKFVLNGGVVTSTDSATAIIIPVGATFYWSGNGTFQRRTVNNFGTAIWTSPWGLDDNAVYNNMPGALTDWPVDGNSNWFGGTSNNFNNFGTLRKSGGTGISSFEYYVNNYGLIEVQSGTLYFGTSGTHAGGDFVLSSGSTIDFAAGNHTLDASTSVTGTGTVLISPTTFAMDGVYNITGSTTIGGGTINFDSTFSTTNRTTINGGTTNFRMMPGHLLGVGNRLNVAGGTVNFVTTDSLKVDTLLVNGTVGGNNPWLVRHYLQLTAGTITSSNRTLSLTLPVGSTFNWSGNGTINQRTVFNYGNANWSSPWGFSDSTIYNNMPGAIINLTTDYNSNWFFATGEPYLINYGTLHKSAGTGVSSFEYQISNYGTLQIDSGLTVLCYDSLVNFGTGIITGKGTLDVSTRMTNAGTIRPGTSPGKLRITGNLRNSNTAVYDAEIGGKNPGQFDELRASGSAALGGTLNLSLLNGYQPALNDSVKVMTYGSKTGAFSTINGLRTGGPYDFVPVYKDTALFLIASDSLNIVPIANNDVITVSEDVTTNMPVLANDVDGNGDGLRVVEILSGYPQHGTAYIGSPDTTIIYTSALNYFGVDTLYYVIYDGRGGWDTARVSITVASVNDRPDAKDTSATANQFGIARINVTATATDVEGSPLFASTASKPKYGEAHVDGNDSFVVYIPPVNFTGIDSFKFYVSDGGAVDSATMVVTVSAGDSFLVTRSNFNTSDEGWNTFNDVSDSAFLASGGNPGGFFHAVDAVTGAWWYFNAPSKFLGDLSSTYNKILRFDIKQKPAGTDNSQPDVILTGTNGVQLNYDFPRNPRTDFTGFGLVLNETSGWTKQIGGLAPSQLEMQNVLANVATLRIRGEFTAGADSAGIDNVILGKIPGNNSPIANADDASTNEEVSVQISPLINDSDPENQIISISAVGNPPNGNAVIDLGNLSITYEPDSNFSGVDSFACYITDGYGGQDSAYIKVTVNNINDAPYVASTIYDTTFTEDFGKKFIAELDSVFRDVDNGPTFGATNLSAGVTPYISGDTLYVLSSAYFNGSVTIALSASDGEYTAVDTFQVTVSGVNNAPLLTEAVRDTSFNEDFGRTFATFLSANFSDNDGDSLTFTSNVLSGGVSVQIDLDSLFITGGSNFNGPAVIRVTAGDGQFTASDTFTVTVTSVNDPVVQISSIDDVILTEDFNRTAVALLTDHFTDADGDIPNFAAVVLDSGVTTSISGDTLYLISIPGFLGTATVRVEASDTMTTVADTFSVTVNALNFPPVLAAALRDTTYEEDFGRVFVTNVDGTFSDPDDATLIYSSNVLGGGAAVQLQNDSLYLTSSADFNGSFNVRVTASDGLNLISDTFNVTVNPVNDAPVIVSVITDQTLIRNFAKTFIAHLTTKFNDADNDPLTFSSANLTTGVNTVISGDSLYVTSDTDFLGQVLIRVTAADAEFTIADTFKVTVNPENFPPTLAEAFRDTSFAEDFGKVFVRSLAGMFSDVDDTALAYGTVSLSAGLSPLVSNDSLYLNSTDDFSGTADIRVYATDGMTAVSDTFAVTVTPVNDAPYRTRIIADQTLLQDFGKIFGDQLSAVFSDIDNGSLTYSVNTLNAGVNGAVSNDTLYLLSTNGFTGASTLRVTAGDGEFTVADTFIVNVNSSNVAPQILTSLRDTIFTEDFGKIFAYKLTSFFTDTDPLTFGATALNSGLTAGVSNDSLYLTSTANFSGTVSVRIAATDGAFTIPDTFVVTVTPVNDGPSAFALISPASNTLSNILRPLFRWNASRDIDGDTLQYLLEISTQSNFSALAQSYSLTDTVQTLTSDLDSTGTYYWRVTASDGLGGNYRTAAFTLRTDATKPNLNISILQGTVAKRYLDVYAYSSEDLSGTVNSTFTLKNNSGTVIDSRSAAMSKIGASNLYTSSYHLTGAGSLEVQVTAQDAAANQRVATRSYTVSALLKGETFAALSPEFEVSLSKPAVSESGFLVLGFSKEAESLSMPSLNTGVELIGTTELKDALKLTMRYGDSELSSLGARHDFDERKIGIYRVTKSGFEYVGGQGRDHAVTVTVSSYGKYVALYDDHHDIVPERIELAQNYPNPFNPSTTIQYGITSSGKVRLVIYNVLGQRVRELVNADRPAGYHKILWDGRNAAGQTVATGMYIYRLETPDGVLSRKMMLIK